MAKTALAVALALRQCAGMTLQSKSLGDAQEDGNLVTKRYAWPSGRGHVGQYSSASTNGPMNLSHSLTWMWHDPAGRYRNSPVGVNIDDEQMIYMTSLDGIRKFSPDGKLLWEYSPTRERGEELPDTASLYNGAVYCSTTRGRIFALSMATGERLWQTKLESCDGNNGWVTVSDGVVITGSNALELYKGKYTKGKAADQLVTGLNATDGRKMWDFQPEAPVWNFMASFAGDGTFVFQDYEGRAYRCRSKTGELIWKNGGFEGSWTDGTALLGPNNLVYTVNTRHFDSAGPDAPGDVSAYALEDGKLVWRKEVPRPPNNQMAVGKVAGYEGLSLVQPIGQQVLQGAPTDVYVLDAETGKLRWTFHGPAQAAPLQAGDRNIAAMAQRQAAGVRPITLPNPWSAPSIDGRGTVYIGSEEGPIYMLRDEDKNGRIMGGKEAGSYYTDACFGGSSSPAFGKDFMAVASIDALYVFKA